MKDAVAKGDFDAVAEEKNAFILFNSGVYPVAKDKAKKAAAIEGTNKIFAAIRSKDTGALKSAYDSYVKENDVKPIPVVDPQKGQGYSSDYSYLAKTPAGYVYYTVCFLFTCLFIVLLMLSFLSFLSDPSMSGKSLISRDDSMLVGSSCRLTCCFAAS